MDMKGLTQDHEGETWIGVGSHRGQAAMRLWPAAQLVFTRLTALSVRTKAKHLSPCCDYLKPLSGCFLARTPRPHFPAGHQLLPLMRLTCSPFPRT